jgi:hypothetical protein
MKGFQYPKTIIGILENHFASEQKGGGVDWLMQQISISQMQREKIPYTH